LPKLKIERQLRGPVFQSRHSWAVLAILAIPGLICNKAEAAESLRAERM
jgi:hypothetical protein